LGLRAEGARKRFTAPPLTTHTNTHNPKPDFTNSAPPGTAHKVNYSRGTANADSQTNHLENTTDPRPADSDPCRPERGAPDVVRKWGRPHGRDDGHLSLRQHTHTNHPHIAFGSLFCLIAIVQLTPEWRMASRSLHKTLGYIAAISGILAAVSAMIMVVIYPTGPFATTTLNVVRFGFAAFMGLCILNAVRNARARRIAYHRAWMIRAFAVAVAASTQAVFMGICFATIGDPSPVLATGLLTLGFAINAIFAEWWIIRARRPAPSFT
jgi:uncharacterized membrane protein